MSDTFEKRLARLNTRYQAVINRPNEVDPDYDNGIYQRYQHPVLMAADVPLFWRYDLNRASNPFLMERLGINAVLNPGAIELDGKILLVARVEGSDRKSFFAVAESKNGIDGFRFWTSRCCCQKPICRIPTCTTCA